MTDEQLQQALKLKADIDESEKHLSEINEFIKVRDINENKEQERFYFEIRSSAYFSFKPSKNYIDISELLTDYKDKVEHRIKLLKEEFAKL